MSYSRPTGQQANKKNVPLLAHDQFVGGVLTPLFLNNRLKPDFQERGSGLFFYYG
jgi:hypothetical protein